MSPCGLSAGQRSSHYLAEADVHLRAPRAPRICSDVQDTVENLASMVEMDAMVEAEAR